MPESHKNNAGINDQLVLPGHLIRHAYHSCIPSDEDYKTLQNIFVECPTAKTAKALQNYNISRQPPKQLPLLHNIFNYQIC